MVRVKCAAALESSKWILSILGVWMQDKITTLQKIQIFIGICTNIAAILIIYQNIVNAAKLKDYGYLNRMTCLLAEDITYTAKWFTLMVNRKYFEAILLDIDSQAFNTHNETLNAHIEYICRTSRILLGYLVIVIAIYLTVGSILPIFLNISLVIPSPFESDVYDSVYMFAHLYMCCYLAIGVMGLDLLYLTLLSMCLAQLNILNGRLVKIAESIRATNELKMVTIVQNYTIVREIVRLHDAINR